MGKKRYRSNNHYAYEYMFLKNILYNLFIWEGLPDSIDPWYLNQSVSKYGYSCGCSYNDEIIVVNGTISGLDRQLKPTLFQSSNPVLPNFKRFIGRDCAILYNTSQYTQNGISDNAILNKYALELANVDTSLLTSLQNSRVAMVFAVNSEEEAQRTRLLYDDISNGKPAVIWYNASSNAPTIMPIKARDNIVTSELNDARRNILANFFTELGIDTLAVDKKERTNLLEMKSNKEQLSLLGNIRLDPRKRWCEEMGMLFDVNISVRYNYDVIDTSLNEGVYNGDTGTVDSDKQS